MDLARRFTSNRLTRIALIGMALSEAQARDQLPYTDRTQQFSGWSATINGDIRTIGIAGATLGLPMSLPAAFENPAGLPYTLGGIGFQLTGNDIADGHVQNKASTVSNSNLIGGADVYPWGFSFGYRIPWNERQDYTIPSTGQDLIAENFTREYHFSIAKVLVPQKLTFGLGIKFGKAVRTLEFIDQSAEDVAHSSHSVGAVMGLMLQLPKRWLLGVSVSSPMHYPASPETNTTSGITNFFQPTQSPSLVGIGAGWVPNRFFQFGTSLYLVGPQSGAALLGDQTATVGDIATVQPRIGAAYKFIEFKELTGHVSLGGYFELARIEGRGSRAHITTGVEINPWIFSLGWGIDFAPNYRNLIFGIGFDFIKFLRKLDLIPDRWWPPSRGFFPNPTRYSDQGLPRPLVANWKQRGPDINIIDVTRNIPGRIEKKFNETKESLQNLFGGEDDKKKKKWKRKTKKKKAVRKLKRRKRKVRPRSKQPRKSLRQKYRRKNSEN